MSDRPGLQQHEQPHPSFEKHWYGFPEFASRLAKLKASYLAALRFGRVAHASTTNDHRDFRHNPGAARPA